MTIVTRMKRHSFNPLLGLTFRHNVQYQRIGKWIVSTNQSEDGALESIKATAALSDVHLHYLSRAEILEETALNVNWTLFFSFFHSVSLRLSVSVSLNI
jgi:hypothetical protein